MVVVVVVVYLFYNIHNIVMVPSGNRFPHPQPPHTPPIPQEYPPSTVYLYILGLKFFSFYNGASRHQWLFSPLVKKKPETLTRPFFCIAVRQ